MWVLHGPPEQMSDTVIHFEDKNKSTFPVKLTNTHRAASPGTSSQISAVSFTHTGGSSSRTGRRKRWVSTGEWRWCVGNGSVLERGLRRLPGPARKRRCVGRYDALRTPGTSRMTLWRYALRTTTHAYNPQFFFFLIYLFIYLYWIYLSWTKQSINITLMKENKKNK